MRRLTHRLALALLAMAVPAAADDWPQWLGPKRDGVLRAAGIVEKLPDELNYR